MAITALLQMNGELAEQALLDIREWMVDEESDFLILLCDKVEEQIN